MENTATKVCTKLDRVESERIHHEWYTASRALWDSRKDGASRVILRAAQRQLNAAQARRELEMKSHIDELCRQRGWNIGKQFTLDQLKTGKQSRGRNWYPDNSEWCEAHHPVLDHVEYFKAGRRPIAIVTHAYATWQDCEAFAHTHSLNVEQLEYSWYYPGFCVAALFTSKVKP